MAQGKGREPCLGSNVKFFICNNNNNNTNLKKKFCTYLSYRSFKPLFFFQISARSTLKKFENEKWPKAGFPLFGFCGMKQELQFQFGLCNLYGK